MSLASIPPTNDASASDVQEFCMRSGDGIVWTTSSDA